MDWVEFVERVNGVPGSKHEWKPPLPPAAVRRHESRLGKLPKAIREMIRVFNGGELFVNADALFTIFGFTRSKTAPDTDWYVDQFTPIWRQKMSRPDDWVIGITNYGGIYVMDDRERVRTWDSSSKQWLNKPMVIRRWADTLISEGRTTTEELA